MFFIPEGENQRKTTKGAEKKTNSADFTSTSRLTFKPVYAMNKPSLFVFMELHCF